MIPVAASAVLSAASSLASILGAATGSSSTPSTSNSSKTSSSASGSTSAAATNGANVTEADFMQLLIAQLQNQDPLSPTDSNQFVSQLTSYSQLEQLIGIHKNTTSLSDAASASSAASSTSTTQAPEK